VYQIYDSVNLRYTLHADIEVLNSIGSPDFPYTPIIAHENSEASCQMYLFTGNDKFEETAAGSELAAEIKEPMDKHGSEVENLKQKLEDAIAAKDKALKELEAERIKMQIEMKKWEEQKKALVDGLAGARADAENSKQEADRKLFEQSAEFARKVIQTPFVSEKAQRDLMRAQICHWEPIRSGEKHFHSASYNPRPIESGVQNGFIMWFQFAAGFLGGVSNQFEGCYVGECLCLKLRVRSKGSGQSKCSFNASSRPEIYHVLVGDPSRLHWVPTFGRFDSRGYDPVNRPGESADAISVHLILRFGYSGGSVLISSKESESFGIYRSEVIQIYEVLCYKY